MMHSSLPRRTFLGAATMGGLAAMGLPVWAQSTWPSRPVNMVVPFPAGGGTDAFARPMAAQFQRLTNRQLVINNIGGGGGTVGASSASKNTPDGYNFFMGAVHHAIAPSMYPRLDYDILTDFEPVLLLASVPQVLVVNPRQIDVNTYAEFVELVRRNPGRYNYGSAGNGTSHHLAGELYKLQTNTFITHIPYRGAGPALADLVAGNVEMMFDGLGSSAGHIQGGRIKALMVSGTERNASPMCRAQQSWVCPTTKSRPGMACGPPRVPPTQPSSARPTKCAKRCRPTKPKPRGHAKALSSPTSQERSLVSLCVTKSPSGATWCVALEPKSTNH